MNFFAYQSVAERYTRSRPYFHPLVIEKIRSYLQLQSPVRFAVDVGCGSGHSTVALKEIAQQVAGLDISAEMLAFAERGAGVSYIRSAAEQLSLTNSLADLLTTSMAFHWFNSELFFGEARRVLKEEAWLVIFNNGFAGEMKENPDFREWFSRIYDERYPTPPRNWAPMTSELAQKFGFRFTHQEDYQNEVEFTVEELAAYLITQSNVIAATERGQEEVEDVYNWLRLQTSPFFKFRRATFLFTGFIWYLQKAF